MTELTPTAPSRRLSRELVRWFRGRESSTLGKIAERSEGREVGLLLVLIGVPFLIPMPSPGLSTPAGLALAVLGGRFLLRSDARLPAILHRQPVSPKALTFLRRFVMKVATWLDRWLKPRWEHVSVARTLIGASIISASLALAVPGPGSNVVPALALVILGLGILARDGLALTVGAVLSVAGWLYVGLIGLAVWHGVRFLA